MITVFLSRKRVFVCIWFLLCIPCTYFLYSKAKKDLRKDFTGDFTGDNAGESRNIDMQYTARNLRKYTKERDIATMEAIKEGKDGCLVSELDNGNSKTYTEAERRAKSLFYKRISQKDKTEFRDLIQTFSKVVSSNITYFLCAGTLYGSYFHHGIVPWDDDVDIIVEDKDKPSLLKFMSILGPEYELYIGRRENWKFFRTQSQKAGKKKWNWPFLDIFFYSDKDSFIQTGRKVHRKFNKSDIFPLITRPFMGMMLPAPRETRKVLDLHYNFDLDVCVSNSYDHRLEKPVPVKCRSRLPCSLLKDKFPFVTRKKSNNTFVEILEINYSFHEYDSWL